MQLSELLASLPEYRVASGFDPAVEVSQIVCDSRAVRPGSLFVAIKGVAVDGHRFVESAVAQGASAIVVEVEQHVGVPQIVVDNGRRALGLLSAALLGYPSRQMRVIGVTGTDGKTSTCNLIVSILRTSGRAVGAVNTVGLDLGGDLAQTGLHTTTPDAPDLQSHLASMLRSGIEYAVIESTSHALDQHRTAGCEYDVAVVTNITHDHLDYHGTYERYREAKGRLFAGLDGSFRKPGVGKTSVLNADDQSYDYLRQFRADTVLTYGIANRADVMAQDIETDDKGAVFRLSTPVGSILARSPMLGLFNVYNALAAATVAISQGIGLPEIVAGIAAAKPVLGRMEPVELGQRFAVLIDFAHTPKSLESALHVARSLTRGKVSVVFGCAGLRDAGKRPIMGEIAGGLADRVVITAEDPRTEDLTDIIQQVATGCERAGKVEGVDYWRVPDRGHAIQFAIDMANDDDLVMVTGKGHEQSMCFGETEYPWSDHEAVKNALRKRLGERTR